MAGVSETWVNPETALGSGGLDVATNDTLAATYFDALASNLDYLGGSDGNQKTGLLNLLAGQIQFPAAQAPSADANTLDDYEEGTWTPVLGGTTTYTTQVGKYKKVGSLTLIWCKLAVNLIGTGSTTAISGLPFTVDSNTGVTIPPASVGRFSALATNVLALYAGVQGTDIYFADVSAAAVATTNNPAIFGNGATIEVSAVHGV